jgi:hypothetical protein
MAALGDLWDHVMGQGEWDDGHVEMGYSGWPRQDLLTGLG